ncbi:6-hydroxymethylpterin diphosphokinase MptE-like protein [Neobacillus rhizosphaerae]|uniref:motility associated factor glycosyltransferase family protein n=1 Tax=Neobacillus rhizosphaerae TaxID=2880965 RepID=UPI003D2706AE
MVIGVGNGILIDKLVRNDIFDKNVHFLFIEPFSDIDLSQETKNIILLNQHKLSFFHLSDFSSLLFSKYLARFVTIPVIILLHPNYLKANKRKIEEIISILKEGIEMQKLFNNTESRFAVDWIVEPLLNLEMVEESINLRHYKDRFEGETAILVSAGPTLHQNMPFVERMQKSCHLFAVGPALRPLMKNGIKPDYALSLDSSDTNYETHFKDINYDGVLIYETMSNHNIQKEHKGKKVVSKALTEQVTPLVFKDIFGFPNSVPSVAIFALQVIKFLGFNEVIFVGQDLALVGGKYYAEGVKNHTGMINTEEELSVINNRGEKVGTTKALKLFLDVFETIIKEFPKDSFRIINISEFGARIEGTEFLSPDKIVKNTVKKEIMIPEFPNEPIHPVNEFLNEMVENLILLKEIIKNADKKIENHLENQIFSKEDQMEMLNTFNEIAENKIVEQILLSNLTYIFDNIINKVVYYDQKSEYTLEDLFSITKELSSLYKIMDKYLEGIIKDSRITKIFENGV